MSKVSNKYAFALHGGAGPVAGRNYDRVETHLRELALQCQDMLSQGHPALDVVEFAVAELEASGLYVAGRGSAPNSAGYVELDASIMHGPTRAAGGVAVIRDFVSPVRVARGVMEKTSHVLLAGNGAAEFGRKHGFDEVTDPDNFYVVPIGVTREEMLQSDAHGTVGAVALDQSGAMAAATSTGGTFGKLEGRVGDTPLIGPGTWADDNVAISCTGIGEHIIRAGGAVSIACAFKSGIPLRKAVQAMLDEVERLGGDAGVIAVSRDGEIVSLYNSDGMKRASASTDLPLRVATFE